MASSSFIRHSMQAKTMIAMLSKLNCAHIDMTPYLTNPQVSWLFMG